MVPPASQCPSDSPAPLRSTFTNQAGTLTNIANDVSHGVGRVIASGLGNTSQTIFILEERHDSRLGQLEIALMLWRLQANYGLRQISLEGALVNDGDLPAQWFHEATRAGAARRAGLETALRLLREGEINAGEFLALVQLQVHVKGNEIESEYAVAASQTSSALGYLVGVAERSLTSSNAQRVGKLVRSQRIEQALDTIFSNDAWARERYQRLYGDPIPSTQECVAILQEIEARVKQIGIRVNPQQEIGFREELNFYRTASKRSCTIVGNTLAMMNAESTAPLALMTGTAHMEKVVELIKAAKVSYVVLSPLSLAENPKAPRLTAPMYQRKLDSKSIDGAGMLGALLDGRKKFPTILGKQWFKSKAAIYLALDCILAAAANDERILPEERQTTLLALCSITIDWPSIKKIREGGRVRVMFKVTAQSSDTDPNETVTIWVVGSRQPSPTTDNSLASPQFSGADFEVEKLILSAISEEKKGAPIESAATPAAAVVVRISAETQAAFSSDPTLLERVSFAN